MSRRAHNTHWSTGEIDDPHHAGRRQKVALCGYDYFMANFNPNRETVSCPECAAKLAKEELAAYHSDPKNPKLELQPVPKEENRSYRYAYRALLGGKHVGYVVFEGAYANAAWYIAATRLEDSGSFRAGPRLDADPTSHYSSAKTYTSKDRALLAVPDLVVAKRLQTVEEEKKERAEWAKERARIDALNQARDAEVAKIRSEALEALIEIRDTMTLSNFQRSGIEIAIKKLTPKKEEAE